MMSHTSAVFFCFLAAVQASGTNTGCTCHGKTLMVGEEYDLPGQCKKAVCMEDGDWRLVSCDSVAVPYKWGIMPEDPSKSFPECCRRAVPPLNIVPDLLDNLRWSDALEILYENITVDQGNELTPTQVMNPPRVNFTAAPESFYLLRMTDADAVMGNERGFHHWLVGNIPGNNVSAGEVIYEYLGSGPRRGSGLHRYVFLLYKQPMKLTFDEERSSNSSTAHRAEMSVRQFSQKYGLGEPQAVNVYQAQFDDYVPQLHRQLGIQSD